MLRERLEDPPHSTRRSRGGYGNQEMFPLSVITRELVLLESMAMRKMAERGELERCLVWPKSCLRII